MIGRSEVEQRWRTEASRVLKSRLVRHGLSYKELARRLSAAGVAESSASIANKISRGSFTFAFYLHCMHVLEHQLQESDESVLPSQRTSP